jgi:hypothetical protein
MMMKISLIFNFAPVRNPRLSHPLLLILFGTVRALPSTLSSKIILGWRCGYCLIPGNCGGSRFFKHRNASKALSHLTKGKDIVTCTGLQRIPANVVHALTALKYSKARRKHNIAVQKNNLHEEVEQQQDHVLGARIDW